LVCDRDGPGLAGLALAWHRAVPVMGEGAGAAALVIGLLAAAVFAVLAVATVLRAQRYPQAWAEDRRHPVRHTFIATLPIAMVLLATVAVASGVQGPLVLALWWAGSLVQLFVTTWVLQRWWKGAANGGLQWAGATPALFTRSSATCSCRWPVCRWGSRNGRLRSSALACCSGRWC